MLALSLRTTSEAELGGDPRRLVRRPSRRPRADDRANVEHLGEIESDSAEPRECERLLPERGETTVADAGRGARPRRAGAPDERPYLITNFALTVDGHATIAGRSGPIGTRTDTAMLVGLRTRVDAVMIGAGTMRAERYGRVIGDPAKRERREREGLPADPLMVIVSGRLDLPWDAALFTEGGGRVPDLHRLRGRAARDRDPGRGGPPARAGSTSRALSRTCAASAGSARCSARAGRTCTRSCSTPGSSTSSSSPTRRSSPAARGRGWSRACASASARSSSPGCWRRRERRALRPLPRAARLIAPGSVGREPASGRSPAQTAPGIGSWSDSSSGISPRAAARRSPRRSIRRPRIVAPRSAASRRG